MPSIPVAEVRRQDVRSRIQEDLARHVQRSHSIGEAYIRFQDVERAWSGHQTIERALYPAELSPAEVELIRVKLLTFLSILVYIDAHDFLGDFQKNIFDVYETDGEHQYCNSKLPLKERDVPSLGNFVLRKRFLDEQYLFVPEVILESATVKHVSDQHRLPFESVSEDLFAGAYGKIDKVGISSSYFKTSEGGTFSEVKYVACKRFHAQLPSNYNDPKRELDNLKVLKESISSHSNIRLHLAIILHKNEHLILLPWADHLDLEIFLNEGRDFLHRKEIYNFRLRFKSIEPGTMIIDICTQMHHVADALKWLHDGIITHGTQNRIRFAHMDLKPNNILIDSDRFSTVGKWVLTDFGISAFKEDDGTGADDLMSVRDYYQNLTINTNPRRDSGAYQPPEVEHLDKNSSERRSAKQGSVGRRGDIWSFACIFAEVLTFSLGQAALLKEFRTVRKGRHNNDYFYEVETETLHPDTKSVSYRVRPQITQWLSTLSARYAFPKNSIGCCVETIQRVLVIDESRRPKAYELLKMFNHVASHVESARAPGGPPPNCPLERSTPIEPSPVVEPSVSGFPTDFAAIHIKRTNTTEEETLLTHQRLPSSSTGESWLSPDQRHNPNANVSLQKPNHVPQSHSTFSLEPQGDPLDPNPPPHESALGLGILDNSARASSISDTTQTTFLSRPSSRESRRDLHGVMINPERVRKMGAVKEITPPADWTGKITSFSLSPSGRQIAYLIDNKKSQYAIHAFEVVAGNTHVTRNVLSLHASSPIFLPSDTTWEGVVSGDDHLVVWGNIRAGTKQVCLLTRKGSKILNGSEHKWLSTLVTVAVSRHGSIAFVCTKLILYTTMDSEIGDADSLPFQETIRAKADHSFTHAAFNDDGSLIYAWEYGRPDDCLSVWRIDGSKRKIILPVDSEGSYPSKQQGVGTATLIPYNTYHGCIIHAQGDAFFPAQIRSTQRGSKLTLEKKTVTLPKAVGACIYGDHSLLVTEKGTFHTRVWEHRIVGGAIHIIDQSREPLVEFKCRAGEDVQMRAVSIPDTHDLALLLCLADGRVFMISVIAQ